MNDQAKTERGAREIIMLGCIALAFIVAASRFAQPSPLRTWVNMLPAGVKPLSHGELKARIEPVPDAENAARVYEKIELDGSQMPRINNHPFFRWNRGLQLVQLFSTDSLPPGLLAEIDETVNANAAAFPLLHKAAGMSRSRYSYEPSDFTWVDSANLQRLSARLVTLANLEVLRAIAYAEHQNPEGVIEAILDGLAIGRSLGGVGEEGFFVTLLGCDTAMLAAWSRAMSRVAFSDEQLARVAGVVQGLDYGQHQRDVLEATISNLLNRYDLYAPGHLRRQRSEFESRYGARAWGSRLDELAECVTETFGLAWWNWFGISDVESAAISTMTDGLMRASRLPLRERFAAATVLGQQRMMLGRWLISDTFWNISTGIYLLRADEHAVTLQRLALTAIAVERYRLAKGMWPGRLEDLVPAYLSEVPIDPFTIEAPHVRKPLPPRPFSCGVRPDGSASASTFFLQSVGRDGVGSPDTTATPSTERSADDIVWSLLPVTRG